MTETKKENEREIVLAILIEVLEKNQFSHIVIRQALDKYSYLPQKDRSFIARLSRGCVERHRGCVLPDMVGVAMSGGGLLFRGEETSAPAAVAAEGISPDQERGDQRSGAYSHEQIFLRGRGNAG